MRRIKNGFGLERSLCTQNSVRAGKIVVYSRSENNQRGCEARGSWGEPVDEVEVGDVIFKPWQDTPGGMEHVCRRSFFELIFALFTWEPLVPSVLLSAIGLSMDMFIM